MVCLEAACSVQHVYDKVPGRKPGLPTQQQLLEPADVAMSSSMYMTRVAARQSLVLNVATPCCVLCCAV